MLAGAVQPASANPSAVARLLDASVVFSSAFTKLQSGQIILNSTHLLAVQQIYGETSNTALAVKALLGPEVQNLPPITIIEHLENVPDAIMNTWFDTSPEATESARIIPSVKSERRASLNDETFPTIAQTTLKKMTEAIACLSPIAKHDQNGAITPAPGAALTRDAIEKLQDMVQWAIDFRQAVEASVSPSSLVDGFLKQVDLLGMKLNSFLVNDHLFYTVPKEYDTKGRDVFLLINEQTGIPISPGKGFRLKTSEVEEPVHFGRTEGEWKQLNNQEVDDIIEWSNREGVQYRVDELNGFRFIVFLDSGTHPLNKYAVEVKSEVGFTVSTTPIIFLIHTDYAGGCTGTVDFSPNVQERTQTDLWLESVSPQNTISFSFPILVDFRAHRVLAQHELDHARTARRILNGKPEIRGIHGISLSEAALHFFHGHHYVADETVATFNSVRRYASDLLEQGLESFPQKYASLEEALKRIEAGDTEFQDLASLHLNLEGSVRVSHEGIVFVSELRAALDSGVEPEFELKNGITWAKVNVLGEDDRHYIPIIGLDGSHGVNDPMNRRIMSSMIDGLEDLVTSHHQASQKMLDAMNGFLRDPSIADSFGHFLRLAERAHEWVAAENR